MEYNCTEQCPSVRPIQLANYARCFWKDLASDTLNKKNKRIQPMCMQYTIMDINTLLHCVRIIPALHVYNNYMQFIKTYMTIVLFRDRQEC